MTGRVEKVEQVDQSMYKQILVDIRKNIYDENVDMKKLYEDLKSKKVTSMCITDEIYENLNEYINVIDTYEYIINEEDITDYEKILLLSEEQPLKYYVSNVTKYYGVLFHSLTSYILLEIERKQYNYYFNIKIDQYNISIPIAYDYYDYEFDDDSAYRLEYENGKYRVKVAKYSSNRPRIGIYGFGPEDDYRIHREIINKYFEDGHYKLIKSSRKI